MTEGSLHEDWAVLQGHPAYAYCIDWLRDGTTVSLHRVSLVNSYLLHEEVHFKATYDRFLWCNRKLTRKDHAQIREHIGFEGARGGEPITFPKSCLIFKRQEAFDAISNKCEERLWNIVPEITRLSLKVADIARDIQGLKHIAENAKRENMIPRYVLEKIPP